MSEDVQSVIDLHMQKVAHRVISVFENADEGSLADDVMPEVFEAIGLGQAFTYTRGTA